MADYEPPEDLIKAQRAYYQADAALQKVTATLPSSLDIVAGTAAITEQQRTRWASARAARLDRLDDVTRHEWWDTVDDRYAASLALQKAAKG